MRPAVCYKQARKTICIISQAPSTGTKRKFISVNQLNLKALLDADGTTASKILSVSKNRTLSTCDRCCHLMIEPRWDVVWFSATVATLNILKDRVQERPEAIIYRGLTVHEPSKHHLIASDELRINLAQAQSDLFTRSQRRPFFWRKIFGTFFFFFSFETFWDPTEMKNDSFNAICFSLLKKLFPFQQRDQFFSIIEKNLFSFFFFSLFEKNWRKFWRPIANFNS